eukprot:TRINITY_DN18894_c2_g1_i1.p1 TRINITY_DN18894_c2_g1~~TRINITY_DN18894_c2_g1_i1.p1  ORF type:complete len:462 (-),score=104.56 TRINITY_DN18894_c2_g1_i1:70-1455(-)
MASGSLPMEAFGAKEPLGEPSWYQNLRSPYYTSSHVAWRAKVRAHVEEYLEPIASAWDEAAVRGDEAAAEAHFRGAYAASCAVGVVASLCGQPWPSAYTSVEAPEGYDAFHELITIDELFRVGLGVGWHTEGAAIGLPPVWTFGVPGNPALQDRCAREVLSGKKVACLAVTEPTGGSDVANIQTTAVDDGAGHFILNGEKKWITNGIYADYFTVAVRTGPPSSGARGLSMLLVERSTPGVETRKMACQGVWASGTTFVTFTDARVPKTNLIGKLNEGFKQIMYNFNHERWALAAQAARLSRVCLEEALRFARVRKTFGKFLVEHQVIQHKLGEMGRACESAQNWLENLTYQLKMMSKDEQNVHLGGHIALLKLHTTKSCEYCAREALQIFGGAGYTRTGKGEKVERIYRELRPIAIGGGSEEIMLNLAASQFRFVGRRTVDARDKRIKEMESELEALRAKL